MKKMLSAIVVVSNSNCLNTKCQPTKPIIENAKVTHNPALPSDIPNTLLTIPGTIYCPGLHHVKNKD